PVAADNRVPVAHCRLPAEVDACLHELRGLLGHLPHAEEHLERLGRTYRSGAPWVAAFAGLLAELFAHTGLLLLDPRDPALAEVAAPLHRRALLDAGPLSRALLERVGVLEQGGFEVSIHVREDAPLSFFQPGSVDGARYRLEPAPGGYREVGGGPQVHSTDALLRALEQEPLRFSTSALLRPLLQDTLLPTAAYVGGPGEIAYFAQLAPLYAAFERPMPLVVPRARFRVVDAKAEELLARLGLSPEDATRDEAELLRRRANTDGSAASSPEAVERQALAGFEAALSAALAGAPLASPGFERAVGHARAKVRQAVARLRRKHEQALLHRDTRLVEDVRRLKALLHPEGVPQERFYGLSAFAARSGERALVDAVLAAVSPFDPRLKDLRP
ncbi:MAG TPA: bacillithiol biosynthesis BshC, partial [Longimicrobium sp.]|nr:bacillithiol biosynthesis BshC [Longimicrobium sp.]